MVEETNGSTADEVVQIWLYIFELSLTFVAGINFVKI